LGSYGLIEEWIGYGVYAIERWPNGRAEEILERLVEFLELQSKRFPEGRSWFTTKSAAPPAMRKKLGSGFYNLGVARGVPGVIGFLSEVVKKGIREDIAKPLLKDAVSWFLAQGEGQHYPLFIPYDCIRGRTKNKIPPFGWCHGDLGVAPVLINAGQILKDPQVHLQALNVGLRACTLKQETAEVENSFFCHGSSGIFHLFNKLYKMTGKEIFRKRAILWADDLFRRIQTKETHSYSLIEGETGIGLCLLSALSAEELHWDRGLMVSFF
jgi:hypothetical protein